MRRIIWVPKKGGFMLLGGVEFKASKQSAAFVHTLCEVRAAFTRMAEYERSDSRL